MITIVDYGMGNLVSIQNMIRKIGGRAEIVSQKEGIADATAIILPGVGHFGMAMEKIRNSGIADILKHKALEEKVPVLGICLGMQLLMERSEEGNANGLGWIPGEVLKFQMADSRMKIPHMGWNHVNARAGSKLFQDLDDNKFYFVHAYYVSCTHEEHVLGTTRYGGEFVSAVQKENIAGVQFHPEKSHRYGMQLLKNFLRKTANE